jgi:TRAP-type C4-dicarboxylate transport system permease small subunit
VKRVLTSLAVLLVVFVVFALIIGPLRTTSIKLNILFFPTIQTSAEALAYASFFIGLVLATVIALAGDMALRKRFRALMLEQTRRSKTSSSKDIADAATTTLPGDRKLPE